MRMACRNLRLVVRMLWHLYGPIFICPRFELGCCTHDIVSAMFSRCGTSTSVSPNGSKLRIYFGKNANPMPLPLSGMCVCHHDTPGPIEDTTLLQPSTSLRPIVAYLTRLTCRGKIHEINVITLWKSMFKHMYVSTYMRPWTVWLGSGTCSRARRGESTLDERCSRHHDTSSVSKRCPLAVSMFWQAPRRTQHHWNRRRRRVVGKTRSDIHAAITWVSVRFKGQLW